MLTPQGPRGSGSSSGGDVSELPRFPLSVSSNEKVTREPPVPGLFNDSFTVSGPRQYQASGVFKNSISTIPRKGVTLASYNHNAAPEPKDPSLFRPRKDRVTSESQRFAGRGPFDYVPYEIIHEIASWLPLSSAAYLTLCNRKLKGILGNRYLLALRQDDSSKHERNLFLQGLDRRSPKTFHCYGCSKLHFLGPRDEDGLAPEERFTWISGLQCLKGNDSDELLYTHVIAFHYHAKFRFEHMQVAMKLYRRGLVSEARSYIKCLALVQPTIREMTYQPTNLGFYFFEPRIVNNQVLVRAQSWVVTPKEQGLLPLAHRTTVCSHIDADHRGANGGRFYLTVKYRSEKVHGGQESCGGCQDLIRCRYCPTEVLVQRKSACVQPEADLTVITKWQTLGYGISPFEPQWESHFQPRAPWPWPPGSTPGAIREAFENQPGVRHDSIFDAENLWTALKEEEASGVRQGEKHHL